MSTQDVDEIDLDEEPPPLRKMTCKSTDCGNNLHCFQQEKQNSKPVPGGKCRDCGVDLVDWSRVHKRDPRDAAYALSKLRVEMIRHKFWHEPLTDRERNYAKRKGRVGMRVVAGKRIRNSVGDAQPYMDGAQTPWKGNVLYYAQHATACCCRTCIAEWHGIPAGRALAADEIEYLTDLVCRYVNERIPELTENGVKIPPIRTKKLPPKG
ncbi:Uncharacterized protein OS=Methylocystis sp. (strain SC2) GN=BN69_0158 PE=4 SV=1: DUF4186 [Gemmata massiliana]|uniref:DUF4186 domain-containing protein n=1 Tax=Gemmata massiliana TaxID=1210884 RepID=A0A6P2CW52_9BACT|nr:DUF4186 family protein [Gemmata massiliana]VTR93368.1 Uncharacterized protein OS=Methylocystis sp. (strain SC2) GN=BN69_0158 PE=4 SV=1: DUF4186 [Gemmata massiliana]